MTKSKRALFLACLLASFTGAAQAEIDPRNYCAMTLPVSPPSRGPLTPAYKLVKTDLTSNAGGRYNVGEKIATLTLEFLGERRTVDAPAELKLPPDAVFAPYRMSDAGDPLRQGPIHYCTAIASATDRSRSTSNAICLAPDYRDPNGPMWVHAGTLSSFTAGVFAGRKVALLGARLAGKATLGPPQAGATFDADMSLSGVQTYIEPFAPAKFGAVRLGFTVATETLTRSLLDPITLEDGSLLAVTDVGGGDIVAAKMSGEEWKAFRARKCDSLKTGN